MAKNPETKYDAAVKSVGREVGMRKNVYPKWVRSGRMTQEQADQEQAAMEEAYGFLRELQVAEREATKPQPDLL